MNLQSLGNVISWGADTYTKDKIKGYDLVEEDSSGKVVLSKSLVDEKNKKERLLGKKTQNTKKAIN